MPFDGKDYQTKVDTSLAGLIAWLEKQPADTVYCYTDNGHCLMAQWVSHLVGGRPVWGSARKGYDVAGTDPEYRRFHFADIETPIALPHPRTFGAALDRARKLAASM